MKDRIPVNPGRVLITPEDGSTAFYATMTRADDPKQEGTPLNKSTFMKAKTASLYGLSDESALPDDAIYGVCPRIGDMMVTRRNDLPDTWLLCNGDDIPEGEPYQAADSLFDPQKDAWTNPDFAIQQNAKFPDGQYAPYSSYMGTYGKFISTPNYKYVTCAYWRIGDSSSSTGIYLLYSNDAIDWGVLKLFDNAGSSNICRSIHIVDFLGKLQVFIWRNDSLYLYTVPYTCDSYKMTTVPVGASGYSYEKVYFAEVFNDTLMLSVALGNDFSYVFFTKDLSTWAKYSLPYYYYNQSYYTGKIYNGVYIDGVIYSIAAVYSNTTKHSLQLFTFPISEMSFSSSPSEVKKAGINLSNFQPGTTVFYMKLTENGIYACTNNHLYKASVAIPAVDMAFEIISEELSGNINLDCLSISTYRGKVCVATDKYLLFGDSGDALGVDQSGPNYGRGFDPSSSYILAKGLFFDESSERFYSVSLYTKGTYASSKFYVAKSICWGKLPIVSIDNAYVYTKVKDGVLNAD